MDRSVDQAHQMDTTFASPSPARAVFERWSPEDAELDLPQAASLN
jgi:hypothetical protein